MELATYFSKDADKQNARAFRHHVMGILKMLYSESTLTISFMYDQGWIWACEQTSNWARPLKSPQPFKRLQRVFQRTFTTARIGHMPCPQRSPFHIMITEFSLTDNVYFLNSGGIGNYSKWSNGWLNVVQRKATFVDVFRGTLELPLWTASRTLVPSFAKLRHRQVKLATSRQLCAKWGHVKGFGCEASRQFT